MNETINCLKERRNICQFSEVLIENGTLEEVLNGRIATPDCKIERSKNLLCRLIEKMWII